MHQNCLMLFKRYAISYFKPGCRVLEIAPSAFPSPYQECVSGAFGAWDSLNIAQDSRLTYSGTPPYSYPIADGTYDVILSSQVLEHVPRIWVWMKELARICKVGGHVITINPLSYPFHGPLDCWRVFPNGMEALSEEAGLDVLMSKCESVEGERFRRVIPGRGIDVQTPLRRLIFNVFGPLGVPVICCYDTITIAQKRAGGTGEAGTRQS